MRSTPSSVAGVVLRLTLLFLAAMCAAQNNPAPVIFQPLTPDHIAPALGNSVNVTVRGANFVADSVVNWNGSPLTTTYVSKVALHAVIPAAELAVAGTGAITVTNPVPGGGTSNVVYFPIHRPEATIALAQHNDFVTVANSGFLWAGALGDFNQDGYPDLAVSNTTAPGIQVFPGNGKGGYGTSILTTASVVPTVMLTGDFNGDGKLDLFCADYNTSQAQMLLGNGDGTFTALPVWTLNAASISVGDFNRDGKLDLVVRPNSLEVLLYNGNGDGTFAAPTEVYKPGRIATIGFPIVGDFNGDGILDFALPIYAETSTGPVWGMHMFQGKGDGTFYATKVTTLSAGVNGGVAADLNHDGKLDIVTEDTFVLLGNGDGSFTSAPNIPYLNAMQLVDINNDGNVDIVGFGDATTTNGSLNTISVLLGNGNGTFQSPLWWTPESISNYDNFIGIADLNGDGLLDATFPSHGFIQGNEVAAQLQTSLNISPNILNFGEVKAGTSSSSQTATLTNIGTGTLKLSDIRLSDGAVLQYSETTTCGASLAPAASCTITVVFSPNVVRGGLNSQVAVVYSQTTGPQFIDVLGVGVN